MIKLYILLYRRMISPLLGGNCRFYPSCSEYSMQVIEKFGAVKGGWLAVRRLAKCHPFHPGGYDPAPEISIKQMKTDG
ncbi:membrane protein insertion efficiency factor YidD [bacterium]|nr:membrane protein insertion efficiency factor YidD [bacterium]